MKNCLTCIFKPDKFVEGSACKQIGVIQKPSGLTVRNNRVFNGEKEIRNCIYYIDEKKDKKIYIDNIPFRKCNVCSVLFSEESCPVCTLGVSYTKMVEHIGILYDLISKIEEHISLIYEYMKPKSKDVTIH